MEQLENILSLMPDGQGHLVFNKQRKKKLQQLKSAYISMYSHYEKKNWVPKILSVMQPLVFLFAVQTPLCYFVR